MRPRLPHLTHTLFHLPLLSPILLSHLSYPPARLVLAFSAPASPISVASSPCFSPARLSPPFPPLFPSSPIPPPFSPILLPPPSHFGSPQNLIPRLLLLLSPSLPSLAIRSACLPLTPPLPSAFMGSSWRTSGDDIYDWVQGSTDSEVSRAAPPPSSSPHPSSLAGVLRAHPVSHRARLPGVGSSAPRGDACGRARLDRSAAAVPD